jgi:hypothetical protein
MCRHDFVLIDLYSQRKAVSRYVEGWSKAKILTWLGQYGEVQSLLGMQYIFWSNIDRSRTVFGFDENDSLLIATSGWYYH